jgi:hypothetical protein
VLLGGRPGPRRVAEGRQDGVVELRLIVGEPLEEVPVEGEEALGKWNGRSAPRDRWTDGRAGGSYAVAVVEPGPYRGVEERREVPDGEAAASRSGRGRAPFDVLEEVARVRLGHERRPMPVVPRPLLLIAEDLCNTRSIRSLHPKRKRSKRSGSYPTSYACCSAAKRLVAPSRSCGFLSGWCTSASLRKDRCGVPAVGGGQSHSMELRAQTFISSAVAVSST